MYTRVFERELSNGQIETINISEYGYEFYLDDKFITAGLVENLDETIEDLISADYVEVK